MDIQTRKIKFVREFLNLQSEELLTLLEKLLHSEKNYSDKKLNPMTLEELKQRIDKSMADSENGRLTNSEELIAEIKQWK